MEYCRLCTTFFFLNVFRVLLPPWHCSRWSQGNRVLKWIDFKGTQVDLLLSDGFSLTGIKRRRRRRRKDVQDKQQYLLFATSNPSVESIYRHMEVCSLLGRFEEREREGSWLCTWCGFFLLVWSQLCLDLPLPFQLWLLPCRRGPRQKQWMHLTVKGSHLFLIRGFVINPDMNVPIAPLFTADVQIEDSWCR